jgi:hypothetical protein
MKKFERFFCYRLIFIRERGMIVERERTPHKLVWKQTACKWWGG